MTTILTVGNSEGSRRCDDRCHSAKSPECDCICGGRYHGRGDAALDMIDQDARDGRFGSDVQHVAVQGRML